MQYKFENSKLPMGIIKEVLHNFNLPIVDVVTKDTVPYEGRVYIKDRNVVKYTEGKYKVLREYRYDKPSLNFTMTMPINSSTYDIDTHEYLGNYLRFIRDFNGIDLMSLYNCFSNRQPQSIHYSSAIYTADTTDDTCNYYLIPVKLNKKYTIAIDSSIAYDIVTIIDSNMTDSITDQLVAASRKRIHGSSFNKPFIYSTDFGLLSNNLWRKERNLMLLLKLPRRIESSIVILEGDYRYNVIDNTLVTKNIVSGDDCYTNNDFPTSYPTRLSLLKTNTKVSYPFADRLVEYMLSNVINKNDSISENIKAVQNNVYESKVFRGIYGLWGDVLTLDVNTEANKQDTTKSGLLKTSNKIRINRELQGYEDKYFVKKFNDNYNDLLYYGDKDIKTLTELDMGGI